MFKYNMTWKTILLISGNTTKYDDQTYKIMSDGTLYSHLDYQSTKKISLPN